MNSYWALLRVYIVVVLFSTCSALLTGLLHNSASCNGRMCSSGEECCRFTSKEIVIGVCAKSCYKHRCASNADCASSQLYCKGKWCEYNTKTNTKTLQGTCRVKDTDCLTNYQGDIENSTRTRQYCCDNVCINEPCSTAGEPGQQPWVFVVCILVILVLVVAMVAFCWRISLYYRQVHMRGSEDESEGPIMDSFDYDWRFQPSQQEQGALLTHI